MIGKNITILYWYENGNVDVSVVDDPITNGRRLCKKHMGEDQAYCESCEIAAYTQSLVDNGGNPGIDPYRPPNAKD